VKFSAVSVSVLPLPSVVLEKLEVAEDPAFGPAPFLTLKQAEVRLRLWPLLRLRVELGDFVLKEPAIALIQRADGRWNITSLGTGGEPRGPARPRAGGSGGDGSPGALGALGSRITVDDGVVTYESRAGGRRAGYRVEDLDLTLKPGLGPLAFEGDARVRPGDLRVKISDGTVGLGEARALTEASLRGRLSLEGKDVRELMAGLMGPEPAIAGSLEGTLALGGTVGKPRASGDLQLSNVTVTQTNAQCPAPTRRTLALGPVKLNATWEEPRFTARPVTTSLAGGSISANVTATLGGAVRVELGDLGIRGLPVEKLLVDFVCQGYAVTGPLDLTGSAAARLDGVGTTLSGRGQFRLGPGKVVGPRALALLETVARIGGAVSALLTGEAPTGLQGSAFDYDSMTATYTITNGVVSTRDLLLTARSLKVTAVGTYALTTGAMNVDLGIATGRRELRARVSGDAASPQVALAPGSRLLTPGEQEKLGESLQELLRKFR
jgi:uncharacterized protein involved in outer membrane biogenesis